jgi:5-methylcytosine-specific restriction protein A
LSFKDITSSNAVLKAIKECKNLGEAKFLEKYGFGKPLSYFLEFENTLYPSKAVMGVAHKYQFPSKGSLEWSDFSGGEKTVRKKLEKMGFKVIRR